MPETKYGLSREGFRRKRLPDILKSLNARVADKLGVPIETGANSLFGQLHGIYAYEIADLWENAEDVYNAMYPNTASGVSLSNAAALAGITQITAEVSSVMATCYGKDDTRIPYGAQISGNSGNVLFTCPDRNAGISSRYAVYADIEPLSTPTDGAVYIVTIDGKQFAYTAKTTDTKETVMKEIAARLIGAEFAASAEKDILTIRAKNERQSVSIELNGLSLRLVGSLVRFVCTKPGAIDPPPGTLKNIVTTIAGWERVTNNLPTSVGRTDETDTELRQRWISSVYERASAMTEAIAAAVYKIDGVRAVQVYENTADVYDTAGRPPHSIESVVDGGDDERIASAIWNLKAGGIDTFGDVSCAVYDSVGFPHSIKFSRPAPVKVWLKATIGENPDEELPLAALTDIGAALLLKGQEQSIGQDVILQRYFAEIFKATKGVGYIELLATTGDSPGAYTKTNIVINDRQIAVFDMSRIEVVKT